MANLPKEVSELVESLLETEASTEVFNTLDTPANWNYDYFLSLHSRLAKDTDKLIVLVPDAVAKGRDKDKTDRALRHTLIAKNLLDLVITLPNQLFDHANAPVTLMLFSNRKVDTTILFINALQKFQTEQSKAMLKEAQVQKIYSTYKRVRAPQPEPSELSSPVCYAAQFDEIKPGIIVNKYAYLATQTEIARFHCSVRDRKSVV